MNRRHLLRSAVAGSLLFDGVVADLLRADGGAAGLRLFQAHRPDIVLLDCLMPRKDGFATCGELRAMPEGEHVPVLMLTSLSDEDSVNRAYESGLTEGVLFERRMFHSLFGTDDQREGMGAFAEKRKPVFKHQ